MNIIGPLGESQKLVNTTTTNIKKISKHISFASAIILGGCAGTSAAAESNKSDIQDNIYNGYYYDDSDQETQDLGIDGLNDSIKLNMSSSNKMLDDSFSYPPNFEPTQATKIREIPTIKYYKWKKSSKNRIGDILDFKIGPICNKVFTGRKEYEIGILTQCEKERKMIYANSYTPPKRGYQTYTIDNKEIEKALPDCKPSPTLKKRDKKPRESMNRWAEIDFLDSTDKETFEKAYRDACKTKRSLWRFMRWGRS